MDGNKNTSTAECNMKSSLEISDTKQDRVMILCDFGQLHKAVWLMEQLETNGYSVWMRVRNLHQDILELAEKADVVLVCISEFPFILEELDFLPMRKPKIILLETEEHLDIETWRFISLTVFEPLDMMIQLIEEIPLCHGRTFEYLCIAPFLSSDSRIRGMESKNVYQARDNTLRELFTCNMKGNPLEAVRPVDVLLAIISDKSIETILQMTTALLESEILDIKSLPQTEIRKDIFRALFDSCKSDLLRTLQTGEHSDDILRSALQYILPINDPSAKAAILNVAGENLKSKLSNQKCIVWGGLDVRIESKGIVSLVCIHRGNLNTQPDSHLGLPVIYREYDRIEREPFDASFRKEYHQTSISPEDRHRATILINKHGEELFKRHSKLQAISPSSVLSSKSRGLKIEPSVVLYCRMKGVIPIGENHFPKTLELMGIVLPTDIREGFFTFAVHEQAQQKSFRPIDRNDKLRMGCSIGGENSCISGTLGPFVRLGSDVGFITCAHVIGLDKEAVLNQTIVQPANGDSDAKGRACGTVLDVHFDPDKPTSVDAALIKVNNRGVAPTDFTWSSPEQVSITGFDSTKPPSFLGGHVRMDTSFSNAQGKRVIKCGKSTGLTKGTLALDGTMVRIEDCDLHFPDRIFWNELFSLVMKNQYLVENNRFPFSSLGDSGAGVYLVENERNDLSLIGIVIGLLNDYTVVTPIGAVLEALQLKPEDVIADEPVQVTTESHKSFRSYCTLQ